MNSTIQYLHVSPSGRFAVARPEFLASPDLVQLAQLQHPEISPSVRAEISRRSLWPHVNELIIAETLAPNH
jgi:hypothetical protein